MRVKTREPMLITDTPTNVFDKVSLDTVTPHGNKHILTMQDQLRVRKAEPVERSKTRISIVQAVTSHVRFQNGKIEK